MNNLRNIRKQRGYTIKQLHEKTGIPVRTIEDWEAEKRQIQFYHRIKLLASVLECSVDELMCKEEKCLYGGTHACIGLIQEEDGVHIEVFNQEEDEDCYCQTLFKAIIEREKALELLKYMKKNKDIKPFFEL